ncbi:hypothetical protein HETIRDRAFT_99831 [Heterobasidion irregulare TC 32-1]|uniref:Serine protease n=1 Tax=Heterobasidion irregulare (strain TC 32-1) TaxID=747525 RepID=W4KP52_HETIT|nr:uncharacterized protein HETIRDRAFT_99831 [Heterobasidion irregulare TC 32-1]ETW87484.1 hypothetical protein HETIRDRAFT_99831 [Heterobasidion irregulare TC 32-1]
MSEDWRKRLDVVVGLEKEKRVLVWWQPFLPAGRTVPSGICLRYATVESPVIVAKPPPPPPVPESVVHSALDSVVLNTLAHQPSGSRTSLPQLVQQYLERSGRVLDQQLPYEPQPSQPRRVNFDASQSEDRGVHLIAHCVQEGNRHKVTLSSGFALNAPGDHMNESVIVTCAHTLEEIRWSPLLVLPPGSQPFLAPPDLPGARSSGTVVLSGTPTGPALHPVTAVLSSLHRSDLLLLSRAGPSIPPLPVSPYPAKPGTIVRAHFFSDVRPQGEDGEGWVPWIGGSWVKWVRGTVLGYRDFAGREAQPGTYDSLSHMLFKPPPTAGSSGGPIVDEETGAVVGVMLGTRMDNRVEGVRGWGVPAEAIFEMFSLPGLNLKR